MRIGEKSERALSSNLDQLATALLNDIDIYGPYIITTLFECLSHLAVKIPIYATLVGLINHVQNDFGKKVVDQLSDELSIAMMTNKENTKSIIVDTNKQRGLETPIIDFNRIRLLLRFASDLYNANIIQLIDILNIIRFLLEQGLNERVNCFVQEHVAYTVILTLIWCTNVHLVNKNEKEIQSVIQRIGEYIENRQDITNPNALRPFKNIQIDLLGDLWTEFVSIYQSKTKQNENDDGDGNKNEEKSNLMKEEKEDIDMKMAEKKEPKTNVFEIKSIYRPYKEFSRLKKKFSHCLKLKQEEYNIGSWESLKVKNLYPIWLEFGIPPLLNQQESEENVSKMERFVAMDYIHDIIEYFNQDTKLCSEQLINLPTSFDAKYVIVEGLVFKMLRLPQCKHHYIIFGKIIIDLFRKQTKVYPRIVGPVINKLFHSIDSVDIECRDRLIEWFSFHLANFNFQWPWENWSNVTSFPPSSPQTAFVRAVMVKCVHLSYYDRFKKTLPTEIISVVPHKPEGHYQYSANNIVAMNLVRMLNQRQSAEDIANHLETFIEPTTEKMHFDELAVPLTEPQDVILRQIELLFVCILHVGKSSCSHVLSFLKLYGKKPLKQLIGQTPINNEESKVKCGQLVLLQCLFSYWQYSPIRIEILLDKLHAMNYVTPQSILQFVFSKASIEHLHQQIYWIVVLQAMDRMVKTTQGMKRGIAKFEQDILELDKNLNSDFNDQEMTMLSKQNKQKQLNQLTNRLKTLQGGKISNSTFNVLPPTTHPYLRACSCNNHKLCSQHF